MLEPVLNCAVAPRDSRRTARNVCHFGPDPGFVGGIASVLETYRKYQLGGSVRLHATWVPDAKRRVLALTAGAIGTVAALPEGAIVHAHLSERGSFVREGAILAQASARGLATVATLHGADFLEFSERHPRLTSTILKQARVIIALSGSAHGRVLELVPRATVRRIANPVAVGEGSTPAESTAELVLFAGELGTRKGVDVLLDAWETIARRRPAARCVLVGPATQLRLPRQERLEVHEPVGHDRMVSLLDEARVVVLPSRAEAMPMILVEAQGAGRPFVSTPVGSIPELAEHGGVLVPVGDAPALAQAIEPMLAQPGLAGNLGRRGRDFAIATRSVEVIDAQLRELYEGL